MENAGTENDQNLFRNDRLLVCGLLILYGFCIIGLTGGAFWWLNLRTQLLSANATSTAVAITTQHANATVTAVAHSTEQAQFEFVDHFEDNSGQWRETKFRNEGRWDGSLELKDGLYVWDVDKVRRPFTQQVNFFRAFPIQDFDAYVDTRLQPGASGHVCGGLAFHKSFKGWEQGAYIFVICADSTFMISYYRTGNWENISDRHFSPTIRPSDWNRIEIHARQDHYAFSINNLAVYEMTDDRQLEGSLGLFMQVSDTTPTTVWFDNFGFQSR